MVVPSVLLSSGGVVDVKNPLALPSAVSSSSGGVLTRTASWLRVSSWEFCMATNLHPRGTVRRFSHLVLVEN